MTAHPTSAQPHAGCACGRPSDRGDGWCPVCRTVFGARPEKRRGKPAARTFLDFIREQGLRKRERAARLAGEVLVRREEAGTAPTHAAVLLMVRQRPGINRRSVVDALVATTPVAEVSRRATSLHGAVSKLVSSGRLRSDAGRLYLTGEGT